MIRPARWRSIRFEEVATGFVSASDRTALFSRALAAFSPAPPPASLAALDGEHGSAEAWCRLRFSAVPTAFNNNSNSSGGSSAASPRGDANAAAAMTANYGERAVVGAEISTLNERDMTHTPLFHLLLRADGAVCFKRAVASSAAAAMSPGLDTLLREGRVQLAPSPWHSWDEDDEAAGAAVASAPPLCTVADASPDHLLWVLDGAGCRFAPGCTVCIKCAQQPNAASTAVELRVAILVFASASSVSGCAFRATLPASLPAPPLHIDCVAGQSEALCTPGSRPPFIASSDPLEGTAHAVVGRCGVADAAASSAEFSADFVAAPQRLAMRAPSLLLAHTAEQPKSASAAAAAPLSLQPTMLAEGFSTADALRLATSPLARGNAAAVPSYLALRAEQSFDRMKRIVDSM
jgi:hypothetical protein